MSITTTVEIHPNVLSTAAVIGDSVVNRAGENLGKIEDLMLDLEKGGPVSPRNCRISSSALTSTPGGAYLAMRMRSASVRTSALAGCKRPGPWPGSARP
ncbi:MAG TPA: PRC-barrel domain-containing protein [Thermoanaerobaculia bacterium]|nr:PRC-barrel domain-containing protein [Thermoanaerobaculia bacterium]